jgi:hypothetical protein
MYVRFIGIELYQFALSKSKSFRFIKGKKEEKKIVDMRSEFVGRSFRVQDKVHVVCLFAAIFNTTGKK